jgi:microcystin-dependent protein
MKSTVATVTNAVKVRFFDRTETLVSTVTVWSSATANPTSWTQKAFSLIPPANARYFKIIIEGVNSTTAGTAYWDGFDVQSNINCPVGSIKEYAGSTVPVGYLNCDGSAISRTEYAALFAVIGTTFGVGDGSTTFNLPDKRGRTGIGAGTGAGLTARTLGQSPGHEQLQSHSHTINTDNSDLGSDVTVRRNTSNAAVSTVTTNTTGAGNAGNMQPSLVLNYQIKI